MLKRKIYNELSRWKQEAKKKALLVKGARQIGKTTIIRDFGLQNYKNFVEINFERMPRAREAFLGNLDTETVVMNLSAMGLGPFEKGETLVFFDEIQSCPEARTAIKFLVEDGTFDYIESGSLLGINYKDVSSYPVGYEHHVDMYALDFEEFLWACGIDGTVIDLIRKSYSSLTPVPEFVHNQLMQRLRQYMITGGMPEVVQKFVESSDLSKVVEIQRDILSSYREDISKYAGNQKVLAKNVFDSIPSQLAKEKKRFVIAELEEGAVSRKYSDAVQWLVDAGVAYFSFNAGALAMPFSMTEKRNMYKLFCHDTGLLCCQLLSGITLEVLNGNISINEGALTENFVAAELSKHGYPLHYYDKKSRQELDFVFESSTGIKIIEVKSGKNYKTHASINTAISECDLISSAVVLSQGNVERGESVIYMPLYMAMFM